MKALKGKKPKLAWIYHQNCQHFADQINTASRLNHTTDQITQSKGLVQKDDWLGYLVTAQKGASVFKLSIKQTNDKHITIQSEHRMRSLFCQYCGIKNVAYLTVIKLLCGTN